MSKHGRERRIHPRKEIRLRGRIGDHGSPEAVEIETYNVSCSGAFCKVPRYIPPFAQLKIVMGIPIHPGNRTEHRGVSVIGTVVRTDPERETPGTAVYRIAVFFADMTAEVRAIIARYVLEHV